MAFKGLFPRIALLALLLSSLVGSAASTGVQAARFAAGEKGNIAYIYRGEAGPATAFSSMLTDAGYNITLISLNDVMATDFMTAAGGPVFHLIIIANDSGYLDQWGSTDTVLSANQLAHIKAPNVPIIGLGEGGYAFFGRLPIFIGWPNGWHGPMDSVQRTSTAPADYYTGIADDPVKLYGISVDEVGIYVKDAPSDVMPIGFENRKPSEHAAIVQQGCRLLWGFGGDPTVMTSDGKSMFLNAVSYMRLFQCSSQNPPTEGCVVTKSAEPADGATVAPDDVIKYTISYTNCSRSAAKLVDSIPLDTIYVPGSASDGIAPGADGSLSWTIPGATTPAGESGTKSFKVIVSDTQCHNQRKVNNRAALMLADAPAVVSNVVSHVVKCPPITLPNDDPPYAEQEVQIHPYPMVTGTASDVAVRLINSSPSAQQVKVSFQMSPEHFGIGIPFSTFDSQIVTIPAGGSIILHTSFTPITSGHYCLAVKIEDVAGNFKPIYTYRNLDVNEDLHPGQPDTLKFRVGNPTATAANINLVVDNTCPGWTATVSPATLSNVGPNSADIRDATLTVTPPNPVTLGSGCHIDVQGWIGDTLIGGIRKLDVPPVHLPTDVNPPWLEPEISLIPNPPVVGQNAQICVELQNPRGVPKTVTVEYAVADFGAGIGFTNVASLPNLVLPPNSNAKYCVPWTPTASNNLHRCILITLKQAGYQDMHSQRNIDLRRVNIKDISKLKIPIKVGNPDGVKHKLEFKPILYGIDPLWKIRWLVDPPPEILPGEVLDLNMGFALQSALKGHDLTQASPGTTTFGDEQRVDVAVLLDGVEVGGFTVQFENDSLYLPLVGGK